MLRLPLTALSIVCLILLSFWSLWRSSVAPFFLVVAVATPTPSVTVVPAPTAAAPTATPVPLVVTTGTVALPPFQFTLPADWEAVHLNRAQVQAQTQPLVPLLINWPPAALEWVAAWPTTPTSPVGLLAYAAPRQTLTLEQYLAESGERLQAQPGVTVHQAAVDYTLHPEVPVALLHYTVTPGDGSAPQAGYQVLLFDQPATNLLLLTLLMAAPATPPDPAQPPPLFLQTLLQTLVR